jgi:hypothetical protein
MRLTFVVAIAALVALVSPQASSAASCSGWRSTCMKRGGAEFAQLCDSKFSACLSSGCFTEGAKFGGATHCGLIKK